MDIINSLNTTINVYNSDDGNINKPSSPQELQKKLLEIHQRYCHIDSIEIIPLLKILKIVSDSVLTSAQFQEYLRNVVQICGCGCETEPRCPQFNISGDQISTSPGETLHFRMVDIYGLKYVVSVDDFTRFAMVCKVEDSPLSFVHGLNWIGDMLRNGSYMTYVGNPESKHQVITVMIPEEEQCTLMSTHCDSMGYNLVYTDKKGTDGEEIQDKEATQLIKSFCSRLKYKVDCVLKHLNLAELAYDSAVHYVVFMHNFYNVCGDFIEADVRPPGYDMIKDIWFDEKIEMEIPWTVIPFGALVTFQDIHHADKTSSCGVYLGPINFRMCRVLTWSPTKMSYFITYGDIARAVPAASFADKEMDSSFYFPFKYHTALEFADILSGLNLEMNPMQAHVSARTRMVREAQRNHSGALGIDMPNLRPYFEDCVGDTCHALENKDISRFHSISMDKILAHGTTDRVYRESFANIITVNNEFINDLATSTESEKLHEGVFQFETEAGVEADLPSESESESESEELRSESESNEDLASRRSSGTVESPPHEPIQDDTISTGSSNNLPITPSPGPGETELIAIPKTTRIQTVPQHLEDSLQKFELIKETHEMYQVMIGIEHYIPQIEKLLRSQSTIKLPVDTLSKSIEPATVLPEPFKFNPYKPYERSDSPLRSTTASSSPTVPPSTRAEKDSSINGNVQLNSTIVSGLQPLDGDYHHYPTTYLDPDIKRPADLSLVDKVDAFVEQETIETDNRIHGDDEEEEEEEEDSQ
ncbi:hypothetical protein WICPIJ_008966 [Wickerhamomyces pijperi]|uniref:Uncharacterized protein n=1 Tax=Wickerhamomyces pijperi TaxID=599730 RepID=A0A9P8PUD1_WICPI|nr:hypothetical protein WICPIJ_008966 [Wickerhamomyces pijperi]